MAIARDASTTLSSATATSLTFSHTCTGSNLVLFVGVYLQNSAGQGDEITGVTYNGVAMSRLVALDYNATNGNYVYIYALANPATGAHNVVVSCSASRALNAASASYTGASQTLPAGTAIKSFTSSSAGACTMNPVTTADGSWAFSMIRNLDGTPTDGTNCAQLSGSTSVETADSNGSTGTAGTITVEMTRAASRWVTATTAFAPVAAASANGNFFAFF